MAKCTKLKADIKKWIIDCYASLRINQTLHPAGEPEYLFSRIPDNTHRPDDMEKLPGVQYLNVVDLVAQSKDATQHTSVILADVDLDIHVFQLFDQPGRDLRYESLDQDEDTEETDRLRAHTLRLPHIDLQSS